MIYYADEDGVADATEQLLELLAEHDAVGIFHLSKEVHDETIIQRFRELFDGVIDLSDDGSVETDF
jgi:hypothetical protein